MVTKEKVAVTAGTFQSNEKRDGKLIPKKALVRLSWLT